MTVMRSLNEKKRKRMGDHIATRDFHFSIDYNLSHGRLHNPLRTASRVALLAPYINN